MDDDSQVALPSLPSIPSYLQAADNHNLGNIGESWFDVNPLNLPKFAAVSVVSGLNSLYNTGVKIGNFLGADAEESDTNTLISGLDSDLGAYYQQNQKAADLMGFLVTSLIPGSAGVKILNAGQRALAVANEGLVGTNIGLALGLRSPTIPLLTRAAAREIATGQATFSAINGSAVKALALGTYQNVLEGAAFETAVQATMQASPVLNDQTGSDVVWNIATGGLFGGVLGGAFNAAKVYGEVKTGVKAFSESVQPFGSRATWIENGVKSDKIISLADDLEHGPVLNPGDPNLQTQAQTLEQRQVRIRNDIRSTIGSMVVGGDTDLGRLITDATTDLTSHDILNNFLDTDQIARLNVTTQVEKNIKEAVKNGTPPNPDHQIAYWKLSGDNAGDVSNQLPEVHNLADMFPATSGQSTRSQILSDVRGQRFKTTDYWDASDVGLGNKGHLDAERRYLWALSDDPTLWKGLKDDSNVGMYDLPVLERALQDGQYKINVIDNKGKVIKQGFGGQKELQDYLIAAKEEVAARLQKKAMLGQGTDALTKFNSSDEGQRWVTEKISKITNIKLSRLEGTAVGDDTDYFGVQAAQAARNEYLAFKGIKPVEGEENDIRFLPSWAKISKVVRDKQVDGNVVDGLTFIKSMKAVKQSQIDNVISKQAGSIAPLLPDFSDSYLAKTNVLGTGARALAINNPEYDSPGSLVSLIGSLLSKFARDEKDAFTDTHTGLIQNLAKNQNATIEWSALNQRVSRSAKTWVKTQDDFGNHALVEAGEYKKIADGNMEWGDLEAENKIEIEHPEVASIADAHASQLSRIAARKNERASVFGTDQAKSVSVGDAPIFRPIPPNSKDYPFIAFVKDPTVTSQGHTSMIFAESDTKLRELVAAAQRARPELDILYKKDTEDFFRARQAYDYDRTLSDNYIDSSLKNQGIYSNYFVSTDPQKVASEYIDHHLRLIDTDARDIIRNKYSSQFDWLEDQAAAFSRSTTSKFGGNFAQLEAQGKNPYLSYIKTALAISRVNEVPLWNNINTLADQTVSKLVGKIQDIWGSNKIPSPEQLESINNAVQKYGMNTGYYNAATNLLVNHSAPKNVLSSFVRGANAVLSKLTLALDPLNSLVNALGANILRTTELSQQMDAALAGNSDISASLAKLYKVDVTGSGDLIRSPAKLMATSMKDFFSKSDDAVSAQTLFKQLGIQRSYSDQFRSIIGEDFALAGNESASDLSSRLQSAIKKANELSLAGERYTGNKLAEEFNRFVSARSAQLLTNPAVDSGILSRQEQYAYINTFVNRVEGNIIASQRPFAFQGPIGQAISLFQSYQFNMMQQMFRYVSEGSTKDAAMLLGLQGTFFGLQGLPAFQAINQHIIGTASGNTQHKDAYDATYGIAGKNLGDLLLYGLPSNLLQTNLYSRGDINPRQLTVLPTALNEVPIVGAYTKFFSNLKQTAGQIAGGSNVWETLLQGIEHNGISRPLSGLAQTLQATTGNGTPFSTTSQGSIMFSNDLFSLSTLSRLAGGRPLDEAIINDGLFRIHSYQQDDLAKMTTLAQEIKKSGIQGQEISQPQYQDFLQQYVQNGGKQVQFNKFMMKEIKAADTSGVDKIRQQIANPFGQKLQLMMGSTSPQVDSLLNP